MVSHGAWSSSNTSNQTAAPSVVRFLVKTFVVLALVIVPFLYITKGADEHNGKLTESAIIKEESGSLTPESSR